MNPRVSVIIPHFNRSDLLEVAVNSVLASSERSFEIIIVDDGSTAEHVARASQLARENVRFLQRQGEPKGPSRCRNQGVAASAAEFIVFLDSDDVMASWCLEQRLQRADTAPAFDMWVFPAMLFDDVPGDRGELWNSMQNDTPPEIRFMQSDPPWHTSSPLWRRDAFIRTGGFNERVFYGDDSDLHMRALLEDVRVSLEAEALPDVFIRRSQVDRITNTPDSAASRSRPDRLREGTRYLRADPVLSRYLPIWEGQYFVEAEYALFNERDPARRIRQTLAQWDQDLHPVSGPPALAKAYFRIAIASIDRAYFVLRLARRAVMAVLPASFFATATDFQSIQATERVKKALHRALPG